MVGCVVRLCARKRFAALTAALLVVQAYELLCLLPTSFGTSSEALYGFDLAPIMMVSEALSRSYFCWLFIPVALFADVWQCVRDGFFRLLLIHDGSRLHTAWSMVLATALLVFAQTAAVVIALYAIAHALCTGSLDTESLGAFAAAGVPLAPGGVRGYLAIIGCHFLRCVAIGSLSVAMYLISGRLIAGSMVCPMVCVALLFTPLEFVLSAFPLECSALMRGSGMAVAAMPSAFCGFWTRYALISAALTGFSFLAALLVPRALIERG